MKLDQYNNPIPTDLIMLDNSLITDFPDRLDLISYLDWYCPDDKRIGYIFVSQSELSKDLPDFDFDYMQPVDLGLEKSEFLKIDNYLKRWNEIDGFYHA